MPINNPWVGYISRSYSSIKNLLLQKLGQVAPEVSDHSESNILVIILSMFAGIAEQFHYYLDNIAREGFTTTARRYSSMVSLVKLIDYRIKAANAASVDVYMYMRGPDGITPINNPSDFTLPQGSEFKTNNGISFITTSAIVLEAGKSQYVIPAKQITRKFNYPLGTLAPVPGTVLLLPGDYAHDSSTIKVGAGIDQEIWISRYTLGYSNPFDKHYIIDVNQERLAYVGFGDNINGALPNVEQPVLLDYNSTKGKNGNVDANTVNIWANSLTIPGVDVVVINNPRRASGGSDIEDLERVRRNAPLSIRTLDRAVTDLDYKDVAMLAPGVDKAGVFYDCGKTIDVFITPDGGGIAPLALLGSTKDFIDFRKIVTTKVRVSPAGETQIQLSLDVWANQYSDPSLTLTDVLNKIYEEFGYLKTDVNRPIFLSDIYAYVDNLSKVNHLFITRLSTIPYARPVYSLNQLNWERETLINSTTVVDWKIVWDGLYFRIFKSGVFMLNLPPNTWWQDNQGSFKLKCSVGDYDYGDEWNFRTYPVNLDINLDDFTVPIIQSPNLLVNVFEM